MVLKFLKISRVPLFLMIENFRVDEKIPVLRHLLIFSSLDLLFEEPTVAADSGHGEPESQAGPAMVGTSPELASSLGSNINLRF